MSGIIFNEDCNHFVYSRFRSHIKVGLKELHEFVDQYKDTGITDFFFNVNGSIGWFPSESRDNAIGNYERIKKAGGDLSGEYPDANGGYIETLKDIYYGQGLDMYTIWLARLREIGINPWISLRTNDIHNNDDEDNFLHSSFFRENKEKRRGQHHSVGACDYYDNALDFCYPEVRDHLFALVAEVLRKFDMYGLEMDWMREIYSLRIGCEEQGAKLITELMERIRKEADKAEKKWGHPIQIATRLPADPLLALRLGFDFFTWADEGLVNLITITPRWATSDNDMPLDLWKKILAGKSVKLAAGQEFLIDAMFTEPKKSIMVNSVETARGTAAANLAMGADSVYLFNYMDDLSGQKPLFKGEQYKQLLCELGSEEMLMGKPRRHIVTYCDVKAPGVPHKNPLPVECARRGSGNPAYVGKPEYKTLRIPVGKVSSDAKMRLVLGVDEGRGLAAEDFDVFLDSEKLSYIGKVALPAPYYPGLEYHAFEIINKPGMPVAHIAEIAAMREPFTIKWAEVAINIL
ncbi:MAG TPA: hypothetical protein PK629_03980 [Oscillospiraceae bacterium]|nr:hypothetical protein [Oscillospiraceae bacterium]HPF56841.1 hypothetical protein [Clostridiales bacterium]HPK35898.1 hypothetical protein [Oscillospiraceae bacterium]HPR76467.1 hypothetical protein [Oscillospiraceae bacterium]